MINEKPKYKFIKIKERFACGELAVKEMEDISENLAKDGYKLILMLTIVLLYLLVFEKVE